MGFRHAGVAKGFTLFELMVVMLITVIAGSFAIAGWQELHGRLRVMTVTRDLLTVLETTRYAALSSRHPLKVCASEDGTRCEMPWRGHLVAFDDRNRNGHADPDENILLNTPSMTDSLHLHWSSFRGEAFLEWNEKGYTAGTNGTFTLCNARHDEQLLRQFVVNRTGRVRVVYPARRGGEHLSNARRACGW